MITLGFVIAIGLPLAVLALAVALPEHRDKRWAIGVPRRRAQPPVEDTSDSQ
ncbi:hypothetical protein ACFXNW_16440 [Nocardia sp. NPDC059180]|uniref:hypothetical protein n=1 Tax=Nocardia sp. NPDC059180 TaxID=3346761 RepID=UPI0036C9E2C1